LVLLRSKKVVGVFVRFSCAASRGPPAHRRMQTLISRFIADPILRDSVSRCEGRVLGELA
jgi:hypothetical protein